MAQAKIPCTHAYDNPAVQLCCEARNAMIQWQRTYEDPAISERLKGAKNRQQVNFELQQALHLMQSMDPGAAYRAAMPSPTTRKAIRDFVACVLHGMSIDAIDPWNGSRLLAGARVASLNMGRKRKRRNPSADVIPAEAEEPEAEESGEEENAA